MTHCIDCGCKIYSGLCSNCHEEAYIMDVQAAGMDLDFEFSREFQDKAGEQRKVARTQEETRTDQSLRLEG